MFKRLLRAWRKMHPVSRSRTVRFAFPAVAVLSTLLGIALAVGSSDVSYVRVEASPSAVRAGDTFTISVYAAAHIPTNAVDIQVSYPEGQLDVLGIDTGESVITIWTEDPYARNGTIYLRGGVFRRGFLGEHLIARVTARATETGVAKILASHTTFLAGDGRGTSVGVTRSGEEEARVQIGEATEIKSTIRLGIVTDTDGDGDVDMGDIQAFLAAWHNRAFVYDFNNDGRMTFRDFAILLADSFFR